MSLAQHVSASSARVAVLHGEVHAAHYADLAPDAWSRLGVPWVQLHHYDERTTAELIRGLGDGRFHAFVLATGALQSLWNQRVLRSDEFDRALVSAVSTGLGVLILQQYLGAGQSFQLPGLPPSLAGELTQSGVGFTTQDLSPGTASLGMTDHELARATTRLRTDFADKPLYTLWEPLLPTRWSDLLNVTTADGSTSVLGYSEVAGSRLFASALPLDRWDCWGLLDGIIARCVRPRGLAVIELGGAELSSDADLHYARDASVARGGFAVHFAVSSPTDIVWSEEPIRLFHDVVVVGETLSGLTGLKPGMLRSRAENGGSVVCRVEAPNGGTTVVRLGGVPFTVAIAELLEAWLASRLGSADSLTTTEFAALGILATAIEDSFVDKGLIPLGLRRRALATTCHDAICRRVDAVGCVDARTLPTAATAASLRMLDITDGPALSDMLDWLGRQNDFHIDPQSQYYAHLAGRQVAAPTVGILGEQCRFWSNLLALATHGELGPDGLAGVVDAAYDDVTLAMAAELILARLPVETDATRAMLVVAIGRLQRRFEDAMRTGSGTLEAITLISAALLRFGRDGELLRLADDVDPDEARARWAQDTVPLQQEVQTLKQRVHGLESSNQRTVDEAKRRLVLTSRFAKVGLGTLLTLGFVVSAWSVTRAWLEGIEAGIAVLTTIVAIWGWLLQRLLGRGDDGSALWWVLVHGAADFDQREA